MKLSMYLEGPTFSCTVCVWEFRKLMPLGAKTSRNNNLVITFTLTRCTMYYYHETFCLFSLFLSFVAFQKSLCWHKCAEIKCKLPMCCGCWKPERMFCKMRQIISDRTNLLRSSKVSIVQCKFVGSLFVRFCVHSCLFSCNYMYCWYGVRYVMMLHFLFSINVV